MCLSCRMPWVPSPIPKIKKQKNNRIKRLISRYSVFYIAIGRPDIALDSSDFKIMHYLNL